MRRIGLLAVPLLVVLGCGSDNSAQGGAQDGGFDAPDATVPPHDGSSITDGALIDGDARAGADASDAGHASDASDAAGAGDGSDGGPTMTASVTQRNNSPTRNGGFVQPTLTLAKAATMTRDATFTTAITGNVYAAPLYVENGVGGAGSFYVVTEDDNVYAIAEATGATQWMRSVGTPAGASGAGCGNINPLGITGTPYIDEASRTIYFDAAIGNANTITKHMVHALSIDDGTERAGWPFDTSTVSFSGIAFNPVLQNQRGALIVAGNSLYVPYGGHGGDCGNYHGWVIAVPLANPTAATGFAAGTGPGVRAGGMWAPGGIAAEGTSVFVASGNTFGANTWQQGEAILRLSAGAAFSGQSADYFAPSDWHALDGADLDIGGSGPVLVDVPGATPSALVVALGKNGVAYLLDRNNLGGIGTGNGTTGEGLASQHVANGEIINAAASYATSMGTYVVFHVHSGGTGAGCPAGQSGGLVSLRIGAASPPTISVAWCANDQGSGSPISTTTNGSANAVVWTAGAEGSRRLHGFNGDTGAAVYAGGGANDQMPNNVRRFTSPIAVRGRIIVGADGALYSFKTM